MNHHKQTYFDLNPISRDTRAMHWAKMCFGAAFTVLTLWVTAVILFTL